MTPNDRDGPLTRQQIDSYETDGFLVVPDVVDDATLRALEHEYDQLLDQVSTRLHEEGLIETTYTNLSFDERFSRVLGEYPDLHTFFNISLPLINGDIDRRTFHMHAGPAVFRLITNPGILDVVQNIVGPEITASPVQQTRMKPPQASIPTQHAVHSNVGITGWHQDIVALLPEADDTNQVTVWVAVTDATEETGCLVSVRRSHRHGPTTHCPNSELASEPQVPDELLGPNSGMPLPVSRGGIILFHKFNIHSALPNRSRRMRWSMDLRYHPTGQPSGRPAFPGFVARSGETPQRTLRDAKAWELMWQEARARILADEHRGPLFADSRWGDPAFC